MQIGFGGAALGNLYRPISDDVAEQTLAAAWQGGMRFFDTAPYYGLGLSERRLGTFLRTLPCKDFVVSTKVGRLLEADDPACGLVDRFGFVGVPAHHVRYDYSYSGVMRSFEASLLRLGLDRIDLLLVHDIGAATHGSAATGHFAALADGGYRALDELRAAGAVSMIGLGVNEWQACAQAMTIGRWDRFLVAGRYTLLEQELLHSFLPQCQRYGAKVIAGGVFNSGILATGVRGVDQPHYNYEPAQADVVARVAQIEQICEAHGVPMAAAALQFAGAHPVIDQVIVGLGSAAEAKTAFDLAAHAIPAACWRDLVAKGLIDPAAPLPGGML